MEKTYRYEADFIPDGVTWITDKPIAIAPELNRVDTENNGSVTYDPGLVYNLLMIAGLEEALKKGVVCSNYVDPTYNWKQLQAFKGGNVVFTQPSTPIKCGGASQKAMYLAADYLRRKGLADQSNIIFATPGSVIFVVKNIADTLMKVLADIV